jgi:Na+/H+ antiporter NhaC
VIAIFVLLALLSAAVLTDSIGTILILNKVVRLQNEVCAIHDKVLVWERITSNRLGAPVPLIGPPPAQCFPG